FGLARALQSWLPFWAVLLAGGAGLSVWAAPMAVGPWRVRLDRWFLWRLYRDAHAIRFLAMLAIMPRQRGNLETRLREALAALARRARPWLAWHVNAMLSRVEHGIVGAGTFETGLFDRETAWFMGDVIAARGLEAGVQQARLRAESRALRRIRREAQALRLGAFAAVGRRRARVDAMALRRHRRAAARADQFLRQPVNGAAFPVLSQPESFMSRTFSVSARRRQSGFSLVEVSIVTAIVLLIAIIGIPAIGAYVIENKVPKVGEELQRYVARIKTNAQGSGAVPYADLDTGSLANALRDSSVVSVSGTGAAAVVAHGLGGSGTGSNGVISIAPASIAASGAGSGFPTTLPNANNAACPGLAAVTQRMSDIISIEGRGGAAIVKDNIPVPRVPYSASAAEAQCAEGDSN